MPIVGRFVSTSTRSAGCSTSAHFPTISASRRWPSRTEPTPEIWAPVSAASCSAAKGSTPGYAPWPRSGRPSVSSRRAGGQFGADGVLSRDDLEWAAEHLHGEAAAAAAWLIANPAFLAAVATAEGDDDYLEDLYRDGFVDGDGGGWADRAPLALGALDAFEAHVGAWSTLIFSGAEIDIAAHGGETDGVLSKADFEAFLARPDLPPELRAAAQRVLDDGAWHDTGGIDFLSILDWATFVPVLGDAIDGAMMLYYLAKGDMANAVAHGVGLVPIPGLSGGAVKGAKELATSVAARYVDDGVSGVARLTARETTQSFVTATVADEVEDVAAQYTDNPYLLATLNVVVDARLGQAADGYRTGLAAGTGASPSATTTPPTDAEIATSLHDTHMFLEEMNAYIDETNDFLGSLDTQRLPTQEPNAPSCWVRSTGSSPTSTPCSPNEAGYCCCCCCCRRSRASNCPSSIRLGASVITDRAAGPMRAITTSASTEGVAAPANTPRTGATSS